ncbi:hypothetical protein ACRRVB_02620 [Candidatus Cardinium hertigii]|uniref:hypothetical protein n=1 Tax=Candidatus Cardinium hertigii TaxID=247481 RepID=UPI003D7D807C
MIHYINRPKSGSLFFLNQVVLLFSILFFGSSCFEGIIKNKGKKPYEYKESITSQRLNERLNKNHNHFMDHLDKASTKIKADCFQDQKEDRKESIRIGGQGAPIRRDNNLYALSEEEDLQKAIEASIETASQENRRRGNNEHTLSEEELQQVLEASIRTASQEIRRQQSFVMESFSRLAADSTYGNYEYLSELAEGREESGDYIEEAFTIPLEHRQWQEYSSLEALAERKEASNDPTEIEEAKKIRARLAKIYDKLLDKEEEKKRAKCSPPISTDEAINKLKKVVKLVELNELTEWRKDCQDKECAMCKDECMLCTVEFNQRSNDCYALTTGCDCNQIVFHIDCMANAVIASYNSMAGKDNNPKYKCPFCRKSLF